MQVIVSSATCRHIILCRQYALGMRWEWRRLACRLFVGQLNFWSSVKIIYHSIYTAGWSGVRHVTCFACNNALKGEPFLKGNAHFNDKFLTYVMSLHCFKFEKITNRSMRNTGYFLPALLHDDVKRRTVW